MNKNEVLSRLKSFKNSLAFDGDKEAMQIAIEAVTAMKSTSKKPPQPKKTPINKIQTLSKEQRDTLKKLCEEEIQKRE